MTRHEMSLQPAYFDLVAAGAKTVEVRVLDSKRAAITEGASIRFRCGDRTVKVWVVRFARYGDFEALLDHEPLLAINPHADRATQLKALRSIYPPQREALGVLAIGVELAGADSITR